MINGVAHYLFIETVYTCTC